MTSVGSACAICDGSCCYEYTVTVTGYDVWCLAQGVRMPPHEFLTLVAARDDNPFGFRLAFGGQRLDIALDKVPSENGSDEPEEKAPCVFLVQLPGGVGRCGVHAHRPQVCQTYPAYLDDDVVRIRDDVMCPTGAWKLVHMHIDRWRDAMQDFVVHRDIYAAVVRAWNARVEDAGPEHQGFSALEYFDFLIGIYREIAADSGDFAGGDWRVAMASWSTLRQSAGDPLDPATRSAVAIPEPVGVWAERVEAAIARVHGSAAVRRTGLSPALAVAPA
jgi:Fe-S-cluster containining protein